MFPKQLLIHFPHNSNQFDQSAGKRVEILRHLSYVKCHTTISSILIYYYDWLNIDLRVQKSDVNPRRPCLISKSIISEIMQITIYHWLNTVATCSNDWSLIFGFWGLNPKHTNEMTNHFATCL